MFQCVHFPKLYLFSLFSNGPADRGCGDSQKPESQKPAHENKKRLRAKVKQARYEPEPTADEVLLPPAIAGDAVPGSVVLVDGLVASPHLNKRFAWLVEVNASNDRWTCQVVGEWHRDDLPRIKFGNLTLVLDNPDVKPMKILDYMVTAHKQGTRPVVIRIEGKGPIKSTTCRTNIGVLNAFHISCEVLHRIGAGEAAKTKKGFCELRDVLIQNIMAGGEDI